MDKKKIIERILIGSGIAFWVLIASLTFGFFPGGDVFWVLGFLILGELPSSWFVFILAYAIVSYFTGKKIKG